MSENVEHKIASDRRAEAVRALREERNGYVRRGLKDRVAQVDAEIARFEGSPKGRSKKAADSI